MKLEDDVNIEHVKIYIKEMKVETVGGRRIYQKKKIETDVINKEKRNSLITATTTTTKAITTTSATTIRVAAVIV